MKLRSLLPLLLAVFVAVNMVASERPASRDVDLKASDGTRIKATYYPAAKPGPGIVLLHQCNRNRQMWASLAGSLVDIGIHVVAIDFRGFGESEGKPFAELTPQERNTVPGAGFPADADAAYQYLVSQRGVDRNLIGAAGASCGVNQSVLLARRHPEVKSLVLLSGTTTKEGRTFLRESKGLPLLGAAADDDGNAVELMNWLISTSQNPASRFQHYKTGGHGIELFAPHPELTGLIVDWFQTTLIKTPGKAPANKERAIAPDSSILELIDSPGGAEKASAKLAEARKRDPKATLFSEGLVNIIGYEHIQAGDNKGGLEIMKLNAMAYPESANVYDSLADAYVANGQPDLAATNAEKCLKLLAADTTTPEAQRNLIRQSAEQKLQKATK